MKVISIGRGEDCNIVLSDNVISRRHAILKIHATGKMELIDMGQNGTFVNGIKLTPNVPYPVTRKDIVSFAHVKQLDWSLIPNTTLIYRYIALGIISALVIAIIAMFLFREKTSDIPRMPMTPSSSGMAMDSVQQEKSQEEKDVESTITVPNDSKEPDGKDLLPKPKKKTVKKEKPDTVAAKEKMPEKNPIIM